MNCRTKALGLALFGLIAGARLGFAADQKAGWEEMKKKHEECLKKSGAFDQKTIDSLADCHKSMMKGKGEGDKPEKGDKEGWKAAAEACMKDKGITLTQAQQDTLKGCHHQHQGK